MCFKQDSNSSAMDVTISNGGVQPRCKKRAKERGGEWISEHLKSKVPNKSQNPKGNIWDGTLSIVCSGDRVKCVSSSRTVTGRRGVWAQFGLLVYISLIAFARLCSSQPLAAAEEANDTLLTAASSSVESVPSSSDLNKVRNFRFCSCSANSHYRIISKKIFTSSRIENFVDL